MSLRKESKRGLIALAVLCLVGVATFASFASSGPNRAVRDLAEQVTATKHAP